MVTDGAAKYKFNSFQEVTGHPPMKNNERIAILFYLLDMDIISFDKTKSLVDANHICFILQQIYKNIAFKKISTIDKINNKIKDITNLIDKCEKDGFKNIDFINIKQHVDDIKILSFDVIKTIGEKHRW